MSFVLTRKLRSGEGEVRNLIDLASQGGYDIIELVWKKFRKSNAKVTGFETPVDNSNRDREQSGAIEVDLDIDVALMIGRTRFCIDSGSRAWGYILDTPYNREKLASQLKVGWYKIVDPKVRKAAEQMAKENGWPTEPQKSKQINIKTSKRERDLEAELKEKEAEALELKRKLEASKKNLTVAEGGKALKGVSIKKDKVTSPKFSME